MSSITDQKIRFYMEHQEQIDEWHRLRDGVHSIADEFFASVWPDLKGLCETAGLPLFAIIYCIEQQLPPLGLEKPPMLSCLSSAAPL